jgi:AcrR family transcriptional regulator
MSPRPRKVSDDEVFLAAQRAISRLGPADLTLARIAQEAGVTAGALVQRFGSKRGLMLQLVDRFSGGTADTFAELRQGHRSPLAVLRAYAECMADMASTPEALLRNFAHLQSDLKDPDFRRRLAISARATREELRRLIKEAIDAGELVAATNARQLARTIEAVVGGSMMSWAMHQEGAAAKWMRDDLNAVLKPYLAK